MIKPIFSTVACPDWSAEAVFETAARCGYLGVELRTFGAGSRGFASDPALTAPEKIRGLSDRYGTPVRSLGTSCKFDDPIWPPVVSHVFFDNERSLREAKWCIDLAITIECPLVRVFGFEPPPRESVVESTTRIAERLKLVVAHAHRTGVRVMLENGGRYRRASEIAAILDMVDSPLLGCCYNVAVAHSAGEGPDAGLNVLGDKLLAVRVKDLRDGAPCMLGDGVVPVKAALGMLARDGFDGPVIFEWDKAWNPGLAPAETVLAPAAARMFEWVKAATPDARPEAARV